MSNLDDRNARPRRLVLEFDRADPPVGRVCADDGQGPSFSGWAGLAAAIDHWLRESRSSATGREA